MTGSLTLQINTFSHASLSPRGHNAILQPEHLNIITLAKEETKEHLFVHINAQNERSQIVAWQTARKFFINQPHSVGLLCRLETEHFLLPRNKNWRRPTRHFRL